VRHIFSIFFKIEKKLQSGFIDNWFCIVIIEQYLLSSLLKKNNAKIKTFFKEYTPHYDDYCKAIGYIHYVGGHKYKENFQLEIQENLKKINPKLYNKVSKQVEKL